MASPQITIIVARSRNGVIGKEGKLPWKLPEDLKFFKEKTQGKPVVMGRKTWESIGRPLPGRQNIVVSRNKNYEAPGAVVVGSLEEAIKACTFQKEVMVIGGANLYAQALPVAENAWVTLIDSDYEGDSFFLNLSPEEWRLVWEEAHKAKTGGLSYRFQKFERIRHTKRVTKGIPEKIQHKQNPSELRILVSQAHWTRTWVSGPPLNRRTNGS